VQLALVAELGQPISRISLLPLSLSHWRRRRLGRRTATLPDGTEVVVKVRRPGGQEQVEEDLAILQRLAAAATRHWEFAACYDLISVAYRSGGALRREKSRLPGPGRLSSSLTPTKRMRIFVSVSSPARSF
jgi:ubiquinone biosynthesis protein